MAYFFGHWYPLSLSARVLSQFRCIVALEFRLAACLFFHECFDISLQVVGDAYHTRLAHQEFSLKIPGRIFGSRLLLKVLPHFGSLWAFDLAQLHQNTWIVLSCRKRFNLGVGGILLCSKFARRESQQYQLMAAPPFSEFLELSILTVGCASFRCDVGCIDDFTFEICHGLDFAIAGNGRKIVKRRCRR